jgi:hypothetical protein
MASTAACFLVSFILRLVAGISSTSVGAFVFACIGLAIALVGGWLGGELVERLGVGVHANAGLDASPSIQGTRHTVATRHRPEEPSPA